MDEPGWSANINLDLVAKMKVRPYQVGMVWVIKPARSGANAAIEFCAHIIQNIQFEK